MPLSSNAILADTRITHVRELKVENDRLTAALARLTADHAALAAHVALAALAARDTALLPKNGKILLLDGWNIILGARPHTAGSIPNAYQGSVPKASTSARQALISRAQAYASTHLDTFVWLVFDGPDATARGSVPNAYQGSVPFFRLSYTGGHGPHRADRLFLDYLRTIALAGSVPNVTLVTADADLRKAAVHLHAQLLTPDEFDNLR